MGVPQTKEIHHHYYYPQCDKYKQNNTHQSPQISHPPSNQNQINKPKSFPVFQNNPGKIVYDETAPKKAHYGEVEIQRQRINLKPNFSDKQVDYLKKNQSQAKKLKKEEMVDQKIQNLQKIIEEYEAGIQKAKQYGKKMQDVTKYQEFKNLSLDVFVQKIQQMGFSENDISSDGVCKKIVVGKISSGKSSLLNNLLKTNLDTGVGQTTEEVALVYNKDNIQIFDTPGENEQFNTQKIQNIKLISEVNQVFILYPDSLKNSQHLIRVITAIKPKHTYLIRTHCDQTSKKDNKTLEEEIKTDYEILQKWRIREVKIFATSSKDFNLFQNRQVQKLLLRYPQKL